MRLTIETDSSQEIEMLMRLFGAVAWENINIVSPSKTKVSPPNITKGDKKCNPRPLFGIWKDNPHSLTQLRSEQWNRNWSA